MTDAPASPHPALRPRLLLIDEDPADRSLALSVLTTLFPLAELTEVSDEAELLPALRREPYDVVIAELEVDWAHWLFLLGVVRAHQERAAIVLFTRRDDQESEREALHAGAAEYVAKSSRGFLDLTQAVDALLEARELDGGGPRGADAEVEMPLDPPEPAPIEPPTPRADRIPPEEEGTEAEEADGGGFPHPATWLRSVRDAIRDHTGGEVGTPLAVFAGVLAITALLTYYVASSGRAGGEIGPRPEGIVAAEVITNDEDAAETPTAERDSEPEADPDLDAALPAASDAPLSLELRARAEVWVKLTLDGSKVMDTTLRAGQKRVFEGERLADLMIGNAAGLVVYWNGRDLGSLGRTGEVRRLHFSPTDFGRGPPPPSWSRPAS